MPDASSYTTISLKADPSFVLTFEGMTVTEELGRPFLIDLDVSSDKPKADLIPLLGGSVTVTIKTTATAKPAYYNGILARIAYTGLVGGAHRYKLELRPWIWLLSRVQDCVIYQEKTPWQIITDIVSKAGFSDAMSDKRINESGSATLEYCVQYCETSFHFITRLMEQYGLYYYFEYTDDKHTLVVADDANSHPAALTIPYMRHIGNTRQTDNHIWDWNTDAHLQPGSFTFRDYNFQTPSADLTARNNIAGKHAHGTSEIYEYPGEYVEVGDGNKLADVRMQALAARRQVMAGVTNVRAIEAGSRFTLTKAPGATGDETYVVVSSVATYGAGESKSQTTDQGELTDTFTCSFTAISDTLTYRLERRTERPIIRGPQTARVVGESGQEITTDKFGRIKVKFFWDRSAVTNQDASCWIRVSQTWAGNLWGTMFIPRIGQEVVVEFLEGNPDRPLVTGVVYNGTNAVPYALPDNKTRSTIKSNSSLGGSGFNEFRFEDKKGSEEVFFQAQKDYNKVVLNNETVQITQDTTTTVKQGNRSVTVSEGNDSHTVSQGNKSVTVSQGNDSVTISTGKHDFTVNGNHTSTVQTGNHSLTVSAGTDSITVSAGTSCLDSMQSITVTVGASSIKIEPAQITLSSPQISIQGQATVAIKAAEVTAEAEGMMSLKSDGLGTLQAGGPLTVKGAIVMIN